MQLTMGSVDDPRATAAWIALHEAVVDVKGYDAVAAELDRRWGRKGRPVSASVLKAALYDAERNNFRLEWVDWFARRDEDIARLLSQQVKPAKTPEQELEDLKAELREELSHKRAEQVLRRARAR